MVTTQKEPVEKFEKPEPIPDFQQKEMLHRFIPQKKIIDLQKKQQNTAVRVAETMLKMPGINTRPEITRILEEIVKTKGVAVASAKALVNKTEQIYSLEIYIKNKPVILTISLDDKNNSTTILLTDKNGKIIEGFYNQSKNK